MPRHLLAWTQSVTGAVTDSEMDNIPDSIVTRSNTKRYSIPIGLNVIDWCYYGSDRPSNARIFTPSAERRRTRLYLIPSNSGLLPSRTTPSYVTLHNGYKLDETEDISVRFNYPSFTGTERVLALVQIGDGKESEIPKGELRVVRMTATGAVTPYTWSLVTVTPVFQLDAGTYALIGFIPFSANCVAARVVIQGQPYRGGVLGVNGPNEDVAMQFAYNYLANEYRYNFGIFDHKSIPQFEWLATSADTTQVVYAILVKIS